VFGDEELLQMELDQVMRSVCYISDDTTSGEEAEDGSEDMEEYDEEEMDEYDEEAYDGPDGLYAENEESSSWPIPESLDDPRDERNQALRLFGSGTSMFSIL
jgi:hypothetical protein